MTAHVVVAPLVIAKSIEGTDVYLYEGMLVPQLRKGELARLGDYIKALPDVPSDEEIALQQREAQEAAAKAEQERFDAAVNAAVEKRLAADKTPPKTPAK